MKHILALSLIISIISCQNTQTTELEDKKSLLAEKKEELRTLQSEIKTLKDEILVLEPPKRKRTSTC